MQPESMKKQGTIEKSAALSAFKVVLGHEAEAPNGAAHPPQYAAENTAPIEPAPAQPSPAERIAELERDAATARARIAELEETLAAARAEIAASTAGLGELQAGLAVAQASAEQRGYAAGLDTARAEVQAELERGLEAWEQGIAQLAEKHRAHGAELRRQAVDIALAATAKIIGERSTDAAQIGAAIEHLIHAGGLAGALKIAVAPAHFELLTREGFDVVQRLHAHAVELRADSRIAYGGCVMEASDATVDARYEVQLEKLRRIVAEYIAGEVAP
jgi:flagellar biosynthesis/type III secretory pathway protein FliH